MSVAWQYQRHSMSRVNCQQGSHDFHHFLTVTDEVNNVQSLQACVASPRDPAGLAALANDLQQHTVLEAFTWIDLCSLRRHSRTLPSTLCAGHCRLVPTSRGLSCASPPRPYIIYYIRPGRDQTGSSRVSQPDAY